MKIALVGAEYTSSSAEAGSRSVRLVLGSDELRELRDRAATAVYASGRHEVAMRKDDFREALELVDAIVDRARHETGRAARRPARRGGGRCGHDRATVPPGAIAVVSDRPCRATHSTHRSPSRAGPMPLVGRRSRSSERTRTGGFRTTPSALLVDRTRLSSRRRRSGS